VDRWVDKLVGAVKGDRELVCANVAAAAQGHSKILLCGAAAGSSMADMMTSMREKCPELKVTAVGPITEDPKAIEGLVDCDAVVLVEQTYRSNLSAIQQMNERAQTMNKPVLGVVLA